MVATDQRFDAAGRFADGAQYIGGRLRPGSSGRTHAVVDHATGEEVLRYEPAGPEDVDAAVAAAEAALPAWGGATPGERSDALPRFADVLARHAAEFAQAESLQCGKPIRLTAGFAQAAAEGHPRRSRERRQRSRRGPDSRMRARPLHDISEMPHGGYRVSGYGKDMSAYSLEEYTQIKHVMSDNTAVTREHWHRPCSRSTDASFVPAAGWETQAARLPAFQALNHGM